ncbi:MAG: ABC transporter ATP-binding protein [Verrucomicrobiota bacterium]|nr:ABC transporter ATP-binding protein [Verrucomicrobiota bacterium]
MIAQSAPVLTIDKVSHRYGDRVAVDQVSIEVQQGSLHGLLGPNGSGKTTLFRVLSTLIPLQEGKVSLCGFQLDTQPRKIQEVIGVVFQHPSLDKKLKVKENLVHQGHLYGLSGAPLNRKVNEVLERFSLSDRAHEPVEQLSGGMKRRVEIAKALLHTPQFLLLDEPATGLDPGSRADMWAYLHELRKEKGMTLFVTTHLMEEADTFDRVAVMNNGKLVADDTPSHLKSSIGGDVVLLISDKPEEISTSIQRQFQIKTQVVGREVRMQLEAGHSWIPKLVEAFPGAIQSASVGKPSLEDVFLKLTGHRLTGEKE